MPERSATFQILFQVLCLVFSAIACISNPNPRTFRPPGRNRPAVGVVLQKATPAIRTFGLRSAWLCQAFPASSLLPFLQTAIDGYASPASSLFRWPAGYLSGSSRLWVGWTRIVELPHKATRIDESDQKVTPTGPESISDPTKPKATHATKRLTAVMSISLGR